MEEITYSNTICGLTNIGNTCYMNAVLQSLLHNKTIFNFLKEKKFDDDILHNIKETNKSQIIDRETYINEYAKSVTYQLFKLLRGMVNEQNVQPISFKKIISIKNSTFEGFNQNDGHELLNFILDSIHEETKSGVGIQTLPNEYTSTRKMLVSFSENIKKCKSDVEKKKIVTEYEKYLANNEKEILNFKYVNFIANYIKTNFSIISQNFTGISLSTIQCSQCHTVTNTFETFNTISLGLPINVHETMLEECLQKFITSETLTDENQYECNNCSQQNKQTKQKRDCTKTITLWECPNNFIVHLKRFMQTGNRLLKNNTCVKIPLQLNLEPYINNHNKSKSLYELTAIIQHCGGFGSGHYVSCVKIDNTWYNFNDGMINKIHPTQLKYELTSPANYVMIYSKL